MAEETQEINQTLGHPVSDKIGSSNLEDSQILKYLSETVQESGIEDAIVSKTLEESFQGEIENVGYPKTLGNFEILDAPVFDHLGKLPLDELDDLLMASIDAEDDQDRLQFETIEDASADAFGVWRTPISYSAGRKRIRGPSFTDEKPFRGSRNGKFHNFSVNETESSRFLTWNDLELCPVGAGLSNMGNTCFLNAILQCFTHIVPLVQGLLSLKHEQSSHGGEFCVLCAVRCQVELSLGHSGRVISPSNLVDNLSCVSSFFRRYQQEDAHEFLQCLLDKLDSDWLKYEGVEKDSSSNDSLVKQIFGGRIVSQVCCRKCGHNSDTYESLIDLSLEIENVDNLESALQSFTKVECIEDTEKFTCNGCKEQVPVEKQLLVDKVPSVAALHLKRFKSNGIYIDKNDKKVDYPLELDLKPYTNGEHDGNEELKFELFGVVVHVGLSSTSGHYFCYIRTAPDTWYRFDDSKVTKVLEATALCQDAYILFYAKKGTEYFSSFFDKWKALSEQKNLTTSPNSVLHDTDLPSTSSRVNLSLDDCGQAKNRTSPPSSSGHFDHDEVKIDRPGKKISSETRSPSYVEINPCTPPRSQSPDSYCDVEPAVEDKTWSAKKTMDNSKNDLKRKEAVRYMSKSMPSGRRRMLMSAMMDTQSQSDKSYFNKKRRKQIDSPKQCDKISPKRVLRPVVA